MSLAENIAALRRLAAILAADVAGYSRLMGADEEGTLARLKSHRRELIDPKIREHRGRIVKTTGNGMLVEFASVVDAVRCAVEVQRGMLDREAEIEDDRRIRFRIGIISATSSPTARMFSARASMSRRAWKHCQLHRVPRRRSGAPGRRGPPVRISRVSKQNGKAGS